jgi:hypothetical protein
MRRRFVVPMLVVAGVSGGLGGALASASSLEVDGGRLHFWQHSAELPSADTVQTDETSTADTEAVQDEADASQAEPVSPTAEPAPPNAEPAPTEAGSSTTQDAAATTAAPSTDSETSDPSDGDVATSTAASTG